MIALNERVLVDADGTRVGVLLDMQTYEQLLEALEEFDDILAYDAAKSSGETPMPLDQAIAEIEGERASL
jgi:hypothetical protein